MKKTGFTLVELLIAMWLLAIIIVAALPSFRAFQREAWMTKAQGDLSVLQLAMEAYYKNVGHYPTMYSNYQTTFMNTPNPILRQYLYDPFAPEKNTVYQYTHSEVPLMQSRYYVINTDNMEPHYHRRGETTRHAWVDEQGIVTWEGHVIWRSNGHAR